MNRILVRFNTKYKEDDLGRKWRVLVNGKESLAAHVQINVPCQTIMEEVDSVEKWHFVCYGVLNWDGNSVMIF